MVILWVCYGYPMVKAADDSNHCQTAALLEVRPFYCQTAARQKHNAIDSDRFLEFQILRFLDKVAHFGVCRSNFCGA